MATTLVVRLDSDGDVLLAGPAVRAVAATGERVVMLVSPRGQAAARLLPDVADVVVWRCPWIDPEPVACTPTVLDEIVPALRAVGADRALVLGSFHQDPLPTALVLRLAGVRWVGATVEDYPGSLLDLRHRPPAAGGHRGDVHEVTRSLSLCAAAGYPVPSVPRLAVRRPLPAPPEGVGTDGYVVVHPGASVPARAPSAVAAAGYVRALMAAGHRVVVTGGPAETALTAVVATPGAVDLGGRTDLAGLAAVLAGAAAVVVGNTGPAHLAAAVGTPVVSLFAPVVPADRWRPWGVPHVLLGDQQAACADTRARQCPVPGHPCLAGVTGDDVVAAVSALTAGTCVTARLDGRQVVTDSRRTA